LLQAIARAYMREADVLILDEPTAALDARSEYEVFRRFKELSEGKTAIVISHRFSSVRMADRILVPADGKVEAAGTHDAPRPQYEFAVMIGFILGYISGFFSGAVAIFELCSGSDGNWVMKYRE
jgi:ABC-type transport system involved in cytochrome bd biosynthesis fused ATPase/permease subunit